MDGLENDLQGRARVLRLNVLDWIGASAAQRFGVRAVPAIFVLNGQGQVTYAQVGIPNRADIGPKVNALIVK